MKKHKKRKTYKKSNKIKKIYFRASYQYKKRRNAKMQKDKKMQKHKKSKTCKKSKKCSFTPAISTSYLLYVSVELDQDQHLGVGIILYITYCDWIGIWIQSGADYQSGRPCICSAQHILWALYMQRPAKFYKNSNSFFLIETLE